MSEFRVWAPYARTVELHVDGAGHSNVKCRMLSDPGGWWSVEHPLPPQSGYWYSIDGGDPVPDPRSACQPHGVHGASRVVDHAAFGWSDSGWQAPPLSSAVIYEMHVGTFTPEGTFESAIARLDHLVELGVTHLELMPVNEFPGRRGWGYDGVDLYAPHHAYGDSDSLKRLVDVCHSKGLAVLLDVVYNHLGPVGNYLRRFGPYFSDRHTTPWGEAINMDGEGSHEVRRFFCDNALMWLRDYHFDGLRIDAIHAIFDSSATHFLEQLAMEVKDLEAHLGRHLVLIAESDLNDPRVVTPREASGFGIDAQWSDDFHHALHSVLTGERFGYYQDFGSFEHLAKALRNAYVYDGRFSTFRGRPHGRRPQGLSSSRFLGYLQTHDQVGNRAKGERSSRLMTLDRLKIGAALVVCSPFVPMLFQGEEYAASSPFLYFSDHVDPEIGRAVSEGRRREFAAFGWSPEEVPDPQDAATFEQSKLDWSELDREPHRGMLEWHRQVISLRRSIPALTDGQLDRVGVRIDGCQQWLVLRRGEIAVACNMAPEKRVVPLRLRTVLLSSNSESAVRGDSVDLAPDSVMIGEVQERAEIV
jgi:maltooligosyltrehalose trehalohydrolase